MPEILVIFIANVFLISRDPKIDTQILRGDILLEAGDSPLVVG